MQDIPITSTWESLPTPPSAAPAKPPSLIQGSEYSWLSLSDDDRNVDALTDFLTPKTGCPECGSVWTEVVQVAYRNTCYQGRYDAAARRVHQIGGVSMVYGVRVVCFGGHLAEYDGITLALVPPLPSWALAAMTGLLGMVAFGYMAAAAERAK